MIPYKERQIRFKEMIEIKSWKVKIYTISKIGEFNHPVFYKNAIQQLPDWLEMKNSFNSDHGNVAFLILHSVTEGIFTLINWWVDMYMLNTHIFLSNPDIPDVFNKISGDGLAPCVWELEVINHERVSWTNNVLKKGSISNLEDYFNDVINLDL